MKFEIDTAAKRARLPARKNPYWRGIAGGRSGVSLGYRKRQAGGAGAWIAKVVDGGRRAEARIGPADDEPLVPEAIGYRTAVAKALEWSVREQAAGVAGADSPRPTVRAAVENYVKQRAAQSPRDGKIAEGRLRAHVLSDEPFARTPLHKLQAVTLEEWRERLPLRGSVSVRQGEGRQEIAPSTVNRLLSDLRGAERCGPEAPQRAASGLRSGSPGRNQGNRVDDTSAPAAADRRASPFVGERRVRCRRHRGFRPASGAACRDRRSLLASRRLPGRGAAGGAQAGDDALLEERAGQEG